MGDDNFKLLTALMVMHYHLLSYASFVNKIIAFDSQCSIMASIERL